MNLLDVVKRQPTPIPWAEGEKIPWNDPDFSRRMLREHLSQHHDAASRRYAVIDQQVQWIQRALLPESGVKILDLGCGPGLYAQRFAARGYPCTGVDFSPASIEYARERAAHDRLDCTYIEGDVRAVDYGSRYALAMFLYGEFNVFRRDDAELILKKANAALNEDGYLLLEPHPFAVVERIGRSPSSWYSAVSGLFSERPHLCLMENFWDADAAVATERYYIVDALTGDVTRWTSSMQAYTDGDYRDLLAGAGFCDVCFYPALGSDEAGDLIAITARKCPV